MEARVKVNDNLWVTVNAGDQKDLWQQLSSLSEVFGNNQCGKCNNSQLKYIVREVDGNEYYELICTKCRAKLSFGQHKQGKSLFPKRKDDEGNYLPDGGWLRWDREKKVME